MTKQKLIEVLAEETHMSRREVEKVLLAFTSIVERSVKAGEKVSVTGFGTFDLGSRAARKGVNPQTGKAMQIPAMPIPRFRAGKRFKQVVR